MSSEQAHEQQQQQLQYASVDEMLNQIDNHFTVHQGLAPLDTSRAVRCDSPASEQGFFTPTSTTFGVAAGSAVPVSLLQPAMVPSQSPSPAVVFDGLRRSSSMHASYVSPVTTPVTTSFPNINTTFSLGAFSPAGGVESPQEDLNAMGHFSSYPSPPTQFKEAPHGFFKRTSSASSLDSPIMARQNSLPTSMKINSGVIPDSPKSENLDSMMDDGKVVSTTNKSSKKEKSEKKLHPCPHPGCTRMFTRLYNVKSHMVCHSGERPHKCSECPASFRRKHDLQRHFRTTHSNERPWVCHKCNRSFARRDHYRRHMQVEEVLESRRQSSLQEMKAMGGFASHIQQQPIF